MIVLRGTDKAETIDTTNKIMQNLERNMQQNLSGESFTAAFGNASMSANYVVPDSLSLKDVMKSTRINLLQGVEARLAKAQADKRLLRASNPTT
jgi:hypothetical protein